MNRIDNKFNELKQHKKKALITFVTAGDPSLDTTYELVLEMERNGADIIELGIPYSDPIAEGPVIQRANERALIDGVKMRDVMALVARLREKTQVPLLFLLYYNCIMQYGIDSFFADCAKCGLDGVIIPDFPFDADEGENETAQRHGVHIISLATPTSKDRLKEMAKGARGFLYCVSSLGVTGVRSGFNTNFDEFFAQVKENIKIPTAIGFGISTPEHIRKLKGYSDGLIVGSAIVKVVEESGDKAVQKVGEYVKILRTALDE